MNPRKLRVENLEERTLLAVMAGGAEMPVRAVAPTEAVTWVVNTLEDQLDWTAEDEVVSLREAIGRAETGDTITFDESLAGGTVTLNGNQLSVSKGVTIDASSIGGMTIDANGKSRVFYIGGGDEANPVELICLTIRGGSAEWHEVQEDIYSYYGGGILNVDGMLVITSCTIAENGATNGGGITNYGTMTIMNSAISGNGSGTVAGGILNGGGGMMTIMNSTISENRTNEDGGGVFNGGTMTITDCLILNNFLFNQLASSGGTYGYGGGICNGGSLTMVRSVVSGNSAVYGGGGVCNGDSYAYYGGYSMTVTMIDCIVSGNRVRSDYYGYGGGVCNGLPFFDVDNYYNNINLTLTGCTITDNSGCNGGGIYNAPKGTTMISLCSIVGNKVYSGCGGGVCSAQTGSLTMVNSTVSGNRAATGAGIYGGCQYRDTGTQSYLQSLTLIGCTITGNRAVFGGGIYNDKNYVVSMTSCIVSGNNAYNGAGIYNNSGPLTLTNSVVSENLIHRDKSLYQSEIGAGIYCEYYGMLTMTNCTVVNNYITDNLGTSYPYTAIYSNNIRDEFYNSIIEDYIAYDPSLPLFADPANGDYTLAENSQAIDKGNNDYVTTDIDLAGNARIIGNSVDLGAYEYVIRPEEEKEVPSTVVTTTFDIVDDTDNLISLREAVLYATAGDTITFDFSLAGKSITLDGRELKIDKNLVIDASSIGGIVIDASYKSRIFKIDEGNQDVALNLIALNLINGCAFNGGAIYNCGTLTMTDCLVLRNTTTGAGGGICNLGKLSITNCYVSENNAVEVYDGVTPINFRYAVGIGGGIYNDENATLTLTNSTVSGNTALDGGGIYDHGLLSLINCTIVDNHARTGGGIYSWDGTTLFNSILVLNSASKEEPDIYSWGYNAYNTLLSLAALESLTALDWCETVNCLEYDPDVPLFADFERGDYSLAENSQAINVGNNDYVTTKTDLAGNMRIANVIVDLGAYEYGSSPQTKQLEAPTITTGNRGIYASYGANRHQLVWTAVEHASGYELQYSADGSRWTSVSVANTAAVVTGLTYGQNIKYRVRALGTGSYTYSDWSESKTFKVCPMDIDGDDFIGPGDYAIMSYVWFSEKGGEEFIAAADINGDGYISGGDSSFLANNWFLEAGDADLVFAAYDSGDIEVDMNIF